MVLLYSLFNLGTGVCGWSTPRRPRQNLRPGMTRYRLYGMLGGPQGRSRGSRKSRPPTGIRKPDRPVRSESLYRQRQRVCPITQLMVVINYRYFGTDRLSRSVSKLLPLHGRTIKFANSSR